MQDRSDKDIFQKSKFWHNHLPNDFIITKLPLIGPPFPYGKLGNMFKITLMFKMIHTSKVTNIPKMTNMFKMTNMSKKTKCTKLPICKITNLDRLKFTLTQHLGWSLT